MNNNRSLYLVLSFCTFILALSSCKKEESKPNTLIGTWELKEVYLLENNTKYPLDSFRNIISADIKFNSDSSFLKKDNFASVQILPLSSGALSLQELYDKPRNPNARFIMVNGYKELPITSSKFSVKNNEIHFETKYIGADIIRSEKFFNQFELKNNTELEMYHENMLVYNKQSNTYFSNKMKLLYVRKNF